MPQFSIRDLLVGTALTAAGLAMALYGWHVDQGPLQPLQRVLLPWPIGCAIVGAGMLYPFKKGVLGIVLGVVVSLIVMSFSIHFLA